MPSYKTPGVYRDDAFPAPAAGLRTGVPAFLGVTRKTRDTPQPLTRWRQFEEVFGEALSRGYLGDAVRGFFENGGRVCYVASIESSDSGTLRISQPQLEVGLEKLEPLDSIDLLCAPDIMNSRTGGDAGGADVRAMQAAVLAHCDTTGDRFAILDAPPLEPNEVAEYRKGLSGANGALYYPWIRVQGERRPPAAGTSRPTSQLAVRVVPPCGHVAGVYTRSDERVGVHKAPANEVLNGPLDLEPPVTSVDQAVLNPEGVNCLRAFPGRGIRVWGARTLSRDPAWTYINVRRLFLTTYRWLERNLASVVYEQNDSRLWALIERDVSVYFTALFRLGALKGRFPEEAFYVKVDAETNPPEVREAGQVVTEIGLAPSEPNEFVVVRIIHGGAGVTVTEPTAPV